MNRNKHVLRGSERGSDLTNLKDRTDNAGRRVIYGPDNELLTGELHSGVVADLTDEFADDGKLD